MAADWTPNELPLADTLSHADGSNRLAIIFLMLLGLLGVLGVTGTAVSAVDALLANPAQSCGGP